MGTFKVANFTSNEDDSTFWSRLIQPVAEEEQAGLGQRAARCVQTLALHSFMTNCSSEVRNNTDNLVVEVFVSTRFVLVNWRSHSSCASQQDQTRYILGG